MPPPPTGGTRRIRPGPRCWSPPAAPTARGSSTSTTRTTEVISTVRDPRVAPKDADSAAKLRKRTLTSLDNERPAWLAGADRRLDVAVFAACGWPPDLPDDDLLAQLLALDLERAGT
jgi:hypothetical protein